MPGGRPRNLRTGDQAEKWAIWLLGQLAQAIPVPRTEDFGVDFMGAPLRARGQLDEPGSTFALQIKRSRGGVSVPFGAFRGGKWRPAEVKWLLGHPPFPVSATPFFVATARPEVGTLEIFQTVGLWHARWRSGTFPTEIQLLPGSWDPELGIAYSGPAGDPPGANAQTAPGDRLRWHVQLGKPIVRLVEADLVRRSTSISPVS